MLKGRKREGTLAKGGKNTYVFSCGERKRVGER